MGIKLRASPEVEKSKFHQKTKSPSGPRSDYLVTSKDPLPDFRASLVKKVTIVEEDPLEVMYEIFNNEMSDFYKDNKKQKRSEKKTIADYLKPT